MSTKAMKQALEALEHAEKDSANFQCINTDQTSAAIAALRTAIQQAEAQQPATDEPVGEPFGWWFTEDPDMFCMPGSGFSPFPNKPQHTSECIALYTHPAPGVPDGYALVPIEPTDEMMAEMLGPFIAPFIAINDDNRSAFIEAYPRMLTAAQAQKGQP